MCLVSKYSCLSFSFYNSRVASLEGSLKHRFDFSKQKFTKCDSVVICDAHLSFLFILTSTKEITYIFVQRHTNGAVHHQLECFSASIAEVHNTRLGQHSLVRAASRGRHDKECHFRVQGTKFL